MLENWVDFNKEKPKFTKEYEDIKYSDQLLFFIDDKLYLGYYISTKVANDDDSYEWINTIELAVYSFINFIEDYIPTDDGILGDPERTKNYNIYWSKIDALDIILRIDLLKKKENNNDSKT